jgi:VWFA-related protein
MKTPLAIGLVLGALVAPPQQPVFRARVDDILVPVAVHRDGRPVAGLTATDFELRDNGVVQSIESTALERVPIDATLVLDLSGSVAGQVLQRLKAAVRDAAGALRDEDHLGLVEASHVLHQVFDLGSRDAGSLPLDRLGAAGGGGTSLYDAVAAMLMQPSAPGRRQLVVVFTDGIDSSSIIGEAAVRRLAQLSDVVVDFVVPATGDRAAPPQSIGLAARPDTSLTATALASGNMVTGSADELRARARGLAPWARPRTAAAVLGQVAAQTGGQVVTLDSDKALRHAFEQALDEFRTSYVLQYRPSAPTSGWHDITVAVRKPGTYDVRARKGYWLNAGKGQ